VAAETRAAPPSRRAWWPSLSYHGWEEHARSGWQTHRMAWLLRRSSSQPPLRHWLVCSSQALARTTDRGSYLRFFEAGRTEAMRSAGVPLARFAEHKLHLPPDWTSYRDRWDAAHTVGAALSAIAFLTLLVAALADSSVVGAANVFGGGSSPPRVGRDDTPSRARAGVSAAADAQDTAARTSASPATRAGVE
jgi:hypothetical protein